MMNIQADLDNMHNAQFLLNETLTSKLNVLDKEVTSRIEVLNGDLSSQLNELKKLIQSTMVKPSLVLGCTERDQALAEELLLHHQLETMCSQCVDKGKAPMDTATIKSPP